MKCIKKSLIATSVLLCFGSQIAYATDIDPARQLGKVVIDGEEFVVSDITGTHVIGSDEVGKVEISNTGTYFYHDSKGNEKTAGNKGIWVADNDKYSVLGKSLSISSESGEAVRVNSGGSLLLGGTMTDLIEIDGSGDAGIVVIGSGSKLDVESKNVHVKGVYGIWVQNNTETPQAPDGAASIKIDSDNIVIDAEESGIVAFSNGQMNINGNLTVTAKNAIDVRGNSTVNINQSGDGTVVLNGDIVFETPNTPGDSQNSGKIINSYVNVELSEGSSWTGKAYQLYKVDGELSSNVELTQPPYHGNVTGLALSIKDGATWTMTGDSFANTLNVENGGVVAIQDGVGTVNVEKFDSNAGIVNLPTSATMTVNAMSGQAELNLATKQDGAVFESGTLNIKASDQASLDVHLMNSTMDKELSSDDINSEQAKTLLSNVGGQDVETKTEVKEGLVNNGFGVNSKGETTTNSANTLMQSSLEMASAAPLALNRIMMNDVRKRLGDIRTSNGTHGAWARYDGGKLSGEGGLENDFHTIQVGIDTVPTADAPRMGVAFSYTDSDAEYARGSADMKAYSLAMYGTWMGDNGQFFDLIGRMGTADTDMVVDGQYKGSMDNVALSMSGEFGWRFDVTNSIYVEPQVEATYTYVNDDSLSLSTANYDVDAVHSLLGRIGFAAGMKCPSDYGNVYVRASAVHEFLGDSKITGVNAGNTNVYEIDGKDTWFEYGIGANFNITKSTYMWADVERTTGGALDEDWRATVGVRYAW